MPKISTLSTTEMNHLKEHVPSCPTCQGYLRIIDGDYTLKHSECTVDLKVACLECFGTFAISLIGERSVDG